ncbi:hypothetical protein RJ640_025508 [Escallonia rubra]|uniref:Uncharacterized protein n=1 Tax=Escallonia rubra TaxID=112253 RepID=A0AA88ULV5_9ASTE|nr:hypothetical protein RJ640_025508 [Escallonia rubra]
MGSRPRRPININTRRRPNSHGRPKKSSKVVINGGSHARSSVPDKLEALKNLIPAGNGDIKPDQLFQETADYIVHLQAKVSILQGTEN